MAIARAGQLALGYAIVHLGDIEHWLQAHWWAYDDIICSRLATWQPSATSADNSAGGFESADDRPLNVCVWEQVVVGHERNAWVRHMLTESPDSDAYLADVLPAGDY